MTVLELRSRFFVQRYQEDESLMHFVFSNHILRGQFVSELKEGPVKRALQERIKVQPAISLHDIVVVASEQEYAEATVTVTKKV